MCLICFIFNRLSSQYLCQPRSLFAKLLRGLRQAAPAPMALDMDTLTPWHQLVLKVWNLSAALRLAGVPLPEREWPASP